MYMNRNMAGKVSFRSVIEIFLREEDFGCGGRFGKLIPNHPFPIWEQIWPMWPKHLVKTAWIWNCEYACGWATDPKGFTGSYGISVWIAWNSPLGKRLGESLENLAHVKYKSYSFPMTPLDSVSGMYNIHMQKNSRSPSDNSWRGKWFGINYSLQNYSALATNLQVKGEGELFYLQWCVTGILSFGSFSFVSSWWYPASFFISLPFGSSSKIPPLRTLSSTRLRIQWDNAGLLLFKKNTVFPRKDRFQMRFPHTLIILVLIQFSAPGPSFLQCALLCVGKSREKWASKDFSTAPLK